MAISYSLFYTILFFANNLAYNIPFNIVKPEIKIALSSELKEISGLSWYGQNRLVAIQDEAGIIYILDSNTGEIKEKMKFSFPGDFEGVEVVGSSFYAISSGGTLFTFKKGNAKTVERIEMPLDWRNNTEGLAYDALNNRLLIACKGQAGIKENEVKGKAIYAFDLISQSLAEDPIRILKKSELQKFVKADKFKPSGLSIDPLTGNLYILATAGNLLIVLDKNFGVIAGIKLPAKIYGQPEGICFSPDGDLYISNEAKEHSRASLYHLLRRK